MRLPCILDENEIKPHKIRYYLEKRDPDFDRKMQEVLMVYRDVSIYREGAVHDGRPEPIYTVTVKAPPLSICPQLTWTVSVIEQFQSP